MSALALIEAVKAGDFAEAAKLIKSGADINQQDEQGWTPLNFAAGKGDLSLIKLLVERGADVFKTGRDLRTPYMIALAAGRVQAVKYLREAEGNYSGEKPASPQRKYCKAYLLRELRQYSAWSESPLSTMKRENGNGESEAPFPDDKVVFIHQDFTVTESMWHNENVVFNSVSPGWEEFCTMSLQFKVPDDLDLIVPNEDNG